MGGNCTGEVSKRRDERWGLVDVLARRSVLGLVRELRRWIALQISPGIFLC